MGTKKSDTDTKEGGAVDGGGAVIKEVSGAKLRDFIEEKLSPQEMEVLWKRYRNCREFRQLVDQFQDNCKDIEQEGKDAFVELNKNLPKIAIKKSQEKEVSLLDEKVLQLWQKIEKKYL